MTKFFCKKCKRNILKKDIEIGKKCIRKCPKCGEINSIKYIGLCMECLEYIEINPGEGFCSNEGKRHSKIRGCENFK